MKADIVIYPNPSAGTFRVEFNALPQIKNYTVVIYNLLGEMIYTKKLPASSEIILTNPVKGIYFVVVYGEDRKMCAEKVWIE